ncbi:hypothetical protein LguiA_034506 [Lonicera macranthoides]
MRRSVKVGIKVLIMMIVMGYMMVWVMMPTNTFYLHWLPNIHANVDSSFFGQQGTNILIYTFPILLIAALACLYLHLEKKDVHHYHESAKGSIWDILRRPALVRGPLGIVSWTELWFLIMFIALLVWSFSSYLHSMFANITQQTATTMREKVWEVKLDSAGLMLGLVGNICLAFLFFPVNRGSFLLRLVGLTSESSIKYHIWLGHTAMALFTAHGLCYTIFWARSHQIVNQMLKWDKVGVSNIAGEVALVAGLVMWATTFPHIRRNLFELFYYTHNNLYPVFVVFFLLHVGFSYAFITLPGFYLFLIDRYLRFLQSQQRVRLVSARVLPCQAVELNFSKSPGVSYNPTSTVFIKVAAISKVQWHPFTVTSSSNMEPEKLSVVIKSENDNEGSWSHTLYQKLSSSPMVDHLEASFEGPYGPTSSSQHFLRTRYCRHTALVMVTGGSGITPCISIIRELLFLSMTTNSKIPRVLLVTAFKRSADLTLLDLLFPASTTTHDISTLKLQIEAYITKEKNINSSDKDDNPNHTIWFKPSPLDAPISTVLCSNNWLWLGAILISSSFIFLLLVGFVNQFYIYPIDRNTNMIYSWSSKTALNILFVCVSIAITASVAFVWNKKKSGIEMRQVQNMNAPTPMTSPGPASWYYNADRELESLPHESFVETTKVHYGERPDLKKILLECEGSSIGVLVSGPKKMRQDVASICSSGLANNLHFESISFSW